MNVPEVSRIDTDVGRIMRGWATCLTVLLDTSKVHYKKIYRAAEVELPSYPD